MKKLILLSFLLLSTIIAWSQPANDNCNTAQNLGTLPTPVACPNGVGTAVNVVGTNINATSPNPYTYLLGCQTGGNQPGPALDVWYRFVASGNQVNINITPGSAPVLQNPAITLWSGSCGNLSGFGCDNNGTAAGNNTATFQPLTPGQTYYIQISGMTATSAGNFSMSVNASNDCNNCLQVCNLTSTPSPINGTYQPGQTVTFCFTISSFTQVSANWLHGVIPTFGNGWNLATLTTTPPPSCSGNGGTWQWYTSNTSQATGTTTGPGFYYNSGAQPAGNNFGDSNTGGCTWTFCWTIQTKANCSTGNNLSISINTTADGESGSWTSPACGGDPNYNFAASINCCTTTASGTPPTCFNGTNGTATATPNGVAPYIYSWNTTPIQTTQTATNLSPGNYTVTVTDNTGCVSTATVNISNPSQILSPITSTNVSCNGVTNGSAIVNPSGGTGPYTYSWNTTPVQTTQTATNLSAGNYTVTVTSANNCVTTNSIVITQPLPISVAITSTASTCGQNNGTATASPSGGNSPYTYSWNTTPVQNTQTATNLPAGNYTVTVTGTGSCVATGTVNIAASGTLTATVSKTDVTCNGSNNGTATASPSGGSNYTYSWNTNPVQTTQTATGLSAGTYSCLITAGNCTTSVSITINQPTQLLAAISTTNVSCNGLSNGSALVTPSGGVGPYTYSWNTTPIQTTQTATGLSSGVYSVSVTDANACQVVAQANVTQPNQFSVSLVNSSNPLCFGSTNGSISVTTTGGVGPTFFYSLNGGPTQTSSQFSNLSSGNYTISVTDANSCQSQLTVQLTQPTALSVQSVVTNPSCNGGNNGQITLTPSGGSPGYQFLWSNSSTSNPLTGLVAGNYSVTITDNNLCQVTLTNIVLTQPTQLVINPQSTNSTICIGGQSFLATNASGGTTPYTYNWSNGLTTAVITATPTTTTNYSFTVTDANNCSVSGNLSIVVYPPLSVSSTSTLSPICIGQSTQLNAFGSGGNGGAYTYTWNPGNLTGQSVTVSPQITTTYTVTVTDNCSPNSTSTITINVSPTPQVTYNTTNLSGCEPLTVTFNNTTPSSSSCLWTINGNISNNCNVTQTFQTPGNYTAQLQITNNNGCVGQSNNINIVVYQNPLASFISNPTVANIFEPTISFDNISSSGSYFWNFGDGETSNIAFPNHTYSDTGTYVVQLIVTTQFGCKDTTYSTVHIDEAFSVYIPNAFTPNGDNKNENFGPVLMGASGYSMSIYNRWGELIYDTNSSIPWDGTYKGAKVQQDVYVWKIIVISNDKKKFQFVGKVSVIK